MKRLVAVLSVFCLFTILFCGCSKKPGSVVEDFYNAKNWEERKSLIYDFDGLSQSKVEDYCGIGGLSFKGVTETNEYSKDVYQIKSEYGENRSKYFVVRKVNGAWKIDFKAMLGYSDKTLIRGKYLRSYDNIDIIEITWLSSETPTAELYLIDSKIGRLVNHDCGQLVLIDSQSALEKADNYTGRLNSYFLSNYKFINDTWIEK